MGMFDTVNYEDTCECGRKLTGADFQSKDGACMLAHLEPHQVLHFYAYCRCGRWLSYDVKIEQPVRYTIERTVSIPKGTTLKEGA